MKFTKTQLTTSLAVILGTLSLSTSLTGCSSSGSGSTPSSSSTTSGVITGFGSVYINGVEYETTNATIRVEDSLATESALAMGMVVTLQGSVNSDGMTGTATSISYDDNVEGIVLANTIAIDGKIDVMGQMINVSADMAFESHVPGITMPEEIVPGNVIEVSGYTAGDGMIFGTRIEVKSATYTPGEEIEVKGKVSGATATSFMIGTLNIDYSTATLDGLTAPIADGTYVEAKSIEAIDTLTMTMVAFKVEAEDDDMDDSEGSEVEIEGVVTTPVTDNTFMLNSTIVRYNSDTEFEDGTAADIVMDAKMEVEGTYNAANELVAEEIEFRKGSEIEVDAFIDAIGTDSVTVFGKSFTVDNFTAKDDDSDSDVFYFDLGDLAIGDRIELRGYFDDATSSYIATRLVRNNDDSSELEIEGPVDADVIAGVTTSLSMFGVTVDISAITLTGNIAAGASVEFKGSYDGSQFIATSIED